MGSVYQEIGEEKLKEVVKIFYDIIEQDDVARELHLLHIRGHGISHSRSEQFRFLSGFFGGPKLYVDKFGHANLRQIHEHLTIGPELRQLWLTCMARALEQAGIPAEVARRALGHLTAAAQRIGQS